MLDLGSVYSDVKWFPENDFRILRYLLWHKIMVKEKYFPFDWKFFFNFQKMVYNFKNRKPFFDFEQNDVPCQGMPRTLQDLLRTSLGPARDLTGTHSGLDQDLPGTWPRPAQDLLGTSPVPAWDPPGTWIGLTHDFTRTCPGFHRDLLGTSSRLAREMSGTCPRPTRDLTETRLGLGQDMLKT